MGCFRPNKYGTRGVSGRTSMEQGVNQAEQGGFKDEPRLNKDGKKRRTKQKCQKLFIIINQKLKLPGFD